VISILKNHIKPWQWIHNLSVSFLKKMKFFICFLALAAVAVAVPLEENGSVSSTGRRSRADEYQQIQINNHGGSRPVVVIGQKTQTPEMHGELVVRPTIERGK
jgi:hypothetical protein